MEGLHCVSTWEHSSEVDCNLDAQLIKHKLALAGGRRKSWIVFLFCFFLLCTGGTWLCFQWAPTVIRATMCILGLFGCNQAMTSNLAGFQMAWAFVSWKIKSLLLTAVYLGCFFPLSSRFHLGIVNFGGKPVSFSEDFFKALSQILPPSSNSFPLLSPLTSKALCLTLISQPPTQIFPKLLLVIPFCHNTRLGFCACLGWGE